MKKIILISTILIGFAISSCTVQAQTAMTNPNGLLLDTVTNSTAEGPTIIVKSYQATVSIVVAITKISGTIAGNVNWQGSNDGVSYGTISSTALTDATNTYVYSETPKRYLYYRALISPTGTSSLSYKATEYETKP